MPIFYTDSGSFNTLEVTGSTILSGSLIISGAAQFSDGGLTGSLFGTSSLATSASYALTASYFSGSIDFPNGISADTISATKVTTTDLTASNVQLPFLLDTTAANKVLVVNTLTGKVFTTASVGTGGGGSGTGFPFSGSAVITGSLLVSGSGLRVSGSTTITDGLYVTNSLEIRDGGITLVGGPGVQVLLNSGDTGQPALGFRNNSSVGLAYDSAGKGGTKVVSYYGESDIPTDIIKFYANTSPGGHIDVVGTFTSSLIPETTASNIGSTSNRWGIGHFNNLFASSSVTASIVSASQVTSSGGFFGTSSFAVSSSIAASASYVASASFGGYINFPSGLVVTGSITASAVSASFITSSHVQLNGLSDTTSTNKVLVLDTTTNKIFTTASVGGGGGSGTGFPFSGSAVISGSLIVSSSNNNSPVIISGSTDSFFELEVINFSAGNNASSDIVVSSNNTTDAGNYIDLGINSTTYNAGLVGGASDGYVYFTSSVGELDIGNASPGSTGNVRLFAGGPTSDNTTRIFISSSGNVGIGTSSSLQNRLTVVGGISASIVTSSHVQLIGVTDTTATNKVLVLDTATNKIFTTASVGGGGGSGTGFPFSGSGVVTGSLLISSSATGLALAVTGSTSVSGSVTASTVVISRGFISSVATPGLLVTASDSAGTAQVRGNTYGVWLGSDPLAGIVTARDNAASPAYAPLALDGSALRFQVAGTTRANFDSNGNFTVLRASNSEPILYVDAVSQRVGVGTTNPALGTANAKFGVHGNAIITGSLSSSLLYVSSSGIQVIGNGITGSVFSGSLFNIIELSMAVSGTIVANGTSTVTLDLTKANYYTVSASAAGVTSWVVSNPPPTGRTQTFVVEYINGGIKTNSWFTNTRWPGGVAPSLTSASANPDMLSFTTDDAGANWRGLLLQRGSA